MKRISIVFLLLIIALCLTACLAQPVKNSKGDLGATDLVTESMEPSVSSETLAPESILSETPEQESTPSDLLEFSLGNTYQCVDFAVKNGRIYYINHYDNSALYSVSTDGSDNRKLNDDWSPVFYVSHEQIYYVNGSDNSKLYSMNIDGSGRRKLSDDKQVSVSWNVVGDRIYFSNWDDHSALYSVNTDGSDRKRISGEDTLYMTVLEDRIFYSGELGTEKGIYSIKTDGSGKTKLTDDSPYCITAAGDRLYYANERDDYKLYAIKTDGSGRNKLSDDYAINMAVTSNRIYYINGNERSIYSIKTDGSDRRLLSDDHAGWLAIWDGRIYYMMTGANIYSMNLDGSDKQLVVNLDADVYMDVTYEVSASLSDNMPEYRFVASGVTHGADKRLHGFVMGLNVYDETGLSILSADFSEISDGEAVGSYAFSDMMDTMGLHVVDVNFDGYKDVIILNTFAGAHANTWYYCWLWNAETSSFIKSESFAEICNPAIDPVKKCIYSAGGSGAEYWGGSIYKYSDGKFIMTNDLAADHYGLVETELLNGEMVVVREVRYLEGEETKATEAEIEYYKNSELWQLGHPRWYGYGGHHADSWLGD